MKATFTKLRTGAWGLRITFTGAPPAPGDTVTATRRDGSAESKTIGAVVWTGPAMVSDPPGSRVALATLATAPRAAAGRSRRFVPCGYPGCHPAHCDECDGAGRYG